MRINGNGQDYLNRVGKVSYLRHYFIPEQNNGKDYYVYCINSFIYLNLEFSQVMNVQRYNNIIFKIFIYKNYMLFFFTFI